MNDLIKDIFLSLLGRVFLFIRYRNVQKVQKVLADESEDSYAQAGMILILWIIGLILLFGVGAMLMMTFYTILHHSLHLI
ncbi:hypothetical protein VB776_03320 [Arcicella sp. DC2W]|uniref:DUF1206 domain-containing protein n=1 Tax=Arcicella gelida TaxID=2984195 RepID=A0ABU5S0C7_9BACT|nr:hypothetical protein [Arcicella sp. DC2W]MEA5401932.1 hypothetical protein [Arcicella sp. DC2W]